MIGLIENKMGISSWIEICNADEKLIKFFNDNQSSRTDARTFKQVFELMTGNWISSSGSIQNIIQNYINMGPLPVVRHV